MKIIKFIKSGFLNFSPFELIFYIFCLFLVFGISIYVHDSKVATISAICGITYTFLAGKGRVLCYFIGMIGTVCYCYLSYKNGFFGNCCLYGLYYFPMEIIGIVKWNKNLSENGIEIKKTKIGFSKTIKYMSLAFFITLVFSYFQNTPFKILDTGSTTFSIFGQFLTVKRCYEQWYFWLIVNLSSFLMWLFAYIKGGNCLATVLMWGVYLVLNFYFIYLWKKDLKILSNG